MGLGISGISRGKLIPFDLRVKIDPGSNTSGIALLQESTNKVLWAAEIIHRGQAIHKKMEIRSAVRRNRRSRKTRYRPPRFKNRHRIEGWLPPSLKSRIENIMTWVAKLSRYCPVNALSVESVKFDFQKMDNPEISGIEYQQGELLGFEVKEYLLEKWGRKCAYCDKENVPLEVEHIIPRSRGGSSKESNLTLACVSCNKRKGNKTAEEFGYPEIQKKVKKSYKDAAVVNSTRTNLLENLEGFGLDIETGTGGRTKWNRKQCGFPKEHWLDAACVGESTPKTININKITPLQIIARGHGKRFRSKINKYGFIEYICDRKKKANGYQTGDIVKISEKTSIKAKGKIGRVVKNKNKVDFICLDNSLKKQSIKTKYIEKIIHQFDGYEYPTKTKKAISKELLVTEVNPEFIEITENDGSIIFDDSTETTVITKPKFILRGFFPVLDRESNRKKIKKIRKRGTYQEKKNLSQKFSIKTFFSIR